MSGTPVLRYGEEVGISEGLSLPAGKHCAQLCSGMTGRPAVFSTATDYLFVRLAISRGLGAQKVNVRTQQRDRHSLMAGSTR